MNGKPRNTFDIPETGEGMGLVEASRGALGHWIVVKDKKIANYQAVVPTTWFCGPRDDNGVRGPGRAGPHRHADIGPEEPDRGRPRGAVL